MTNQEAFNRVVLHLANQRAKAVGTDGYCRYRTSNGLRCAVGALIPDEEYRIDFEGLPVEEIDVPVFKGLDLQLLSELQLIHDEYATDAWPEKLASVARNYGLDPAVLSTVIWKEEK